MVSSSQPSGLYLVDGDEVIHLHTGDEQNVERLREYVDSWDLLEDFVDE